MTNDQSTGHWSLVIGIYRCTSWQASHVSCSFSIVAFAFSLSFLPIACSSSLAWAANCVDSLAHDLSSPFSGFVLAWAPTCWAAVAYCFISLSTSAQSVDSASTARLIALWTFFLPEKLS